MSAFGSLLELSASDDADDLLRFRIRNHNPDIRAMSSKAPIIAPAMAPPGTVANLGLYGLSVVSERRDKVAEDAVVEEPGDGEGEGRGEVSEVTVERTGDGEEEGRDEVSEEIVECTGGGEGEGRIG